MNESVMNERANGSVMHEVSSVKRAHTPFRLSPTFRPLSPGQTPSNSSGGAKSQAQRMLRFLEAASGFVLQESTV